MVDGWLDWRRRIADDRSDGRHRRAGLGVFRVARRRQRFRRRRTGSASGSELVARGKELNDPNHAAKRLAAALKLPRRRPGSQSGSSSTSSPSQGTLASLLWPESKQLLGRARACVEPCRDAVLNTMRKLYARKTGLGSDGCHALIRDTHMPRSTIGAIPERRNRSAEFRKARGPEFGTYVWGGDRRPATKPARQSDRLLLRPWS